MKFSYKFLLATLFILSTVIFANIFALKHYAGTYFNDYILTIQSNQDNLYWLDNSFINNILSNKDLDPALIKEYQEISNDLNDITNSLDRFSKNPKASNIWLLESLQKSWIPQSQIEQIIWTNAIQSFFSSISNIFSLDATSDEWKFILKTIKSMAYFNLILITLIWIMFYFWVVYSFRPIRDIIDNLSNIIYKKEYKNIVYKKWDEFRPLIDTINNLNKSLSLQEKIRSDFLSDLSHEIKTPITAIKCYLEWIEDWVIETNDNNMNMLYNEIERLIKITNSIMEYEKEESMNFWDIFIEKVDLSNLTEFIISEYYPLISRNEQEIISYIPAWYHIQADKDKITQLLHNIFSNFIKYSGKDTTLNIKSYNKANQHVITFFDNGKWVNKDELPFIKEKFYKVEKSRNKEKDSWIWIGLSVIEKIVKLHSGELSIDSEPKKGFEITIILPK